MYKWVSVYFDENEFKKLESIMEMLKEKGVEISKYALLKAWILRIFKKIDEGDFSWLEGLEEELEKNKVQKRSSPRAN